MSEGEPRKLSELRVVDLRVELEKRGLEKSGVKAALIERLGKALRDEGKDPDTYVFEERAKRLSIDKQKEETEPETTTPVEDASKESPKDESTKEDSKENDAENQVKSTEIEPEEKKETDEKTVEAEQNGGENEDSLHLTIEDDDQLLEEPEEKPAEEEVNKPDDESTTAKKTESTTPTESKPDEDEEESKPVEDDSTTKSQETGDDHVKKDADEESATTTDAHKAETDGDTSENKKETSPGHQDGDESVVRDQDGKGEDDDGVTSTNAAEKEDENDTKKENSVANEESGQTTSPPTDATKENDSSTPVAASAPAPAKKNDKDAGRSLWISGLASKTRATDLKQLLSKYGKVVGAKVVANARAPSARCYGYVVMATVADADNCIKYCHRTELHGRFICIDKARSDRADSDKRKDSPNNRRAAEDKLRNRVERGNKSRSKDKQIEKKDGEKDDKSEKREGNRYDKDGKEKSRGRSPRSSSRKKDRDTMERNRSRSKRREGSKSVSKDEKRDSKKRDDDTKSDKSRDRRRSRDTNSKSQTRDRRSDRESPDRRRRRSPSIGRNRRRKSPDIRKRDVLTVKQIRDERERQRMRVREREIREAEERRRREEQQRVRELERRNKKEAQRIERERERLRIERERIQREKADFYRMERKRIEQERIELQNMKLEESRRPTKRTSDDRRDSYPEDRKRILMTPSSHRYDTTDPMHFEITSRSDSLAKKHDLYKGDDYKREIDGKSRGVDGRSARDDYKRNDIRMRDEIRDDIRMRGDIRSRDDYSKRDRPDFAPPPPRLSGGSSNVISKYSNVSDSPPYGNQGRSAHDMLRRDAISSSVIAGGRVGSGIGKDLRYTDRVGPPGQSPEPSQNSYRDYGDRDHAGGWHGAGSNQLKPFPSPVGMGVNSNNDPARDAKKFEPWIHGPKGDNQSMMWSSAGRGMDSGPTTGRYDRSNMERR
ncbi:SAFB-like transcription modulator isoform X2 [Chrysoperla carnea]|uniref:SAFB-like transcription modulator isoform X2 n=1 Tax=Chrysoperla carnea TaxID=189513 RepID=UPI001D087CDE|nr:SAFB-like transcription modulator isoform X2 [Chrysoperla carnea]